MRVVVRSWVTRCVSVSVGVGLIAGGIAPARATEPHGSTAEVGSANVGGALVQVDERTGRTSTSFGVASLAGFAGSGALDLLVSYMQERAGIDQFGLGAGWGFNITHVNVTHGHPVVFPASGGMFDADATAQSGLARYPHDDLVFTQQAGLLDIPVEPTTGATDTVLTSTHNTVEYGFILESVSGNEYFSPRGFLVARTDAFGNATRWEWDQDTGRLLSVTDRTGNQITLNWTDDGLRVHTPTRADGVTPPPVVIDTTSTGIRSVTNPMAEVTTFTYDNGLLNETRASSGLSTRVTYRPVGNSVAATLVTVHNEKGEEVSRSSWEPVGENLFTGFPQSPLGEAALWSSGDGQFRYSTRVSDGFTRVISTWNNMGVLLERSTEVSTREGTRTVRDDTFVYDGTQTGGVPTPGLVPTHYNKPVTTTTTYRDGTRSRSVSEHTQYDTHGRAVSHTDALGAVTTTAYDNTRVGTSGLLSGLVQEQIFTGTDGTVSKTVNTPAANHRTIEETETFTGTTSELVSVAHTRFVTETDGFVGEKTVSGRVGTDALSGPENITTRYTRGIDRDARTVTVTETFAAETSAENTTTVVSDLSTGLVFRTIDPIGRVSENTYDSAGRVVAVTDPAGRVTTTSYENHGTVSRVRTPDGVVTSSYADVLGRVTRTTDNIVEGPNGAPTVSALPDFERTTQTREYAENNARVTVTDSLGRSSVSASDVFGRPVLTSLENGLSQVSVFDDVAGTVTTGVTATPDQGLAGAQRTSTRFVDDAGRDTKITSTRMDGVAVPEVVKTFDGLGRVTHSTAGDIQTATHVNADGTPHTTTTTPVNTSVFPGEPVTATRTHNTMGISTNKTLTRGTPSDRSENDAQMAASDRGEGVARVMDAAGRELSRTDQAGGVTRFTHTVDGLVTESVEEASGTVTHNSYDPVTRVLTEQVTTRPGAEPIRRGFTYDPVTDVVLAVFDPADRASTQVTYGYDVLGNQTTITYPDGMMIAHVFDTHGRKTETRDVAGNITRFTYNNLGLLTESVQTTPVGDAIADVAYDYDTFGRVTNVTRDNGATTRYTFTSADEVKTEHTTDPAGNTIFEGSYDYDTHGNLTHKTVTGQHADTNSLVTETTRYAYNAYNQLTNSSVYAGAFVPGFDPETEPVTQTRYEISVTGNITKHETVENNTVTVREFEYNTLGQTTAIITNGERAEQEYDAAGNLVTDAEGARYGYDIHNRPVTHTNRNGTETSTRYWANGKKKSRADDGESTGFYWDGGTLVNESFSLPETDNDAHAERPLISSYLFGANRVARSITPTAATDHQNNVAHNDTEHYVNDRHGNVVALVDMANDVTASYHYTDYGNTITRTSDVNNSTDDDLTNRFQYAGEYTNSDGSQTLGKRLYSPDALAFTTRDTAPLYNLYAYGNANPITRVDPSGQTSVDDLVINGTVAGAGSFAALIGFVSHVVALSSSGGFFNGALAAVTLIDLAVMDLLAADTAVAQERSRTHVSTPSTHHQGFLPTHVSAALGWTAFGTGMLAGATGVGSIPSVRAARARAAAEQAFADLVSREVGETTQRFRAAGLHLEAKDVNASAFVNDGTWKGVVRPGAPSKRGHIALPDDARIAVFGSLRQAEGTFSAHDFSRADTDFMLRGEKVEFGVIPRTAPRNWKSSKVGHHVNRTGVPGGEIFHAFKLKRGGHYLSPSVELGPSGRNLAVQGTLGVGFGDHGQMKSFATKHNIDVMIDAGTGDVVTFNNRTSVVSMESDL